MKYELQHADGSTEIIPDGRWASARWEGLPFEIVRLYPVFSNQVAILSRSKADESQIPMAVPSGLARVTFALKMVYVEVERIIEMEVEEPE